MKRWRATTTTEKYRARPTSWNVRHSFLQLFTPFPVSYSPFFYIIREFKIADCYWRRAQGFAREKNCRCERKRESGDQKKRKKDREKAEVNGVTWPKDAKLPKRSTRKAWSAPITEPLLAAIMIIAYLERERSCACTQHTCVSAACAYICVYTGCPTIIYYYFLSTAC